MLPDGLHITRAVWMPAVYARDRAFTLRFKADSTGIADVVEFEILHGWAEGRSLTNVCTVEENYGRQSHEVARGGA